LEEREFNRVGGSKTIKVDVRLVTATNKDLTQQIKKGMFREDLYYRINVVPIVIPPLRERREDIPVLVEHFIKKATEENGGKVKGMSQEALALLTEYDWPGNVRELENLIERMVALTPNELLQARELPFPSQDPVKAGGLKDKILKGNVSLLEAEEEFEREIIADALKKANNVQSQAAELLGISRRILKYKMDKLGIEQDRSGTGVEQ
jgi:DNA-binding NtrC family response regulator